MTAARPNARPLTVTIRPPWSGYVRDVAQGQGVTYLSLVEACVQAGLAAGGPTVLEPFGKHGMEAIDEV